MTELIAHVGEALAVLDEQRRVGVPQVVQPDVRHLRRYQPQRHVDPTPLRVLCGRQPAGHAGPADMDHTPLEFQIPPLKGQQLAEPHPRPKRAEEERNILWRSRRRRLEERVRLLAGPGLELDRRLVAVAQVFPIRKAGFACSSASSTACDSTALNVRLTPRIDAILSPFARQVAINSRQSARLSVATRFAPP